MQCLAYMWINGYTNELRKKAEAIHAEGQDSSVVLVIIINLPSSHGIVGKIYVFVIVKCLYVVYASCIF